MPVELKVMMCAEKKQPLRDRKRVSGRQELGVGETADGTGCLAEVMKMFWD